MSKRKIGSPGFLLALALIFIFVAMNMLPYCFHHGAIERARRVGCAGNLKQIGLGIKRYAEQHDGAYPSNFSAMSSYVTDEPSLFVCYSAGSETGSIATVDEWTDYTYVHGLSKTSKPDCVLAYCTAKNHKGKGGNILFLDGHVEWFNAKGNTSGETSFEDVIGTIRGGGRNE